MPNKSANASKPTPSVGKWVCGTLSAISMNRSTIPVDNTGKPRSLPNCPSTIDNAMPLRNPIRMGLDRKSASTPSRKRLAPRHIRPTKKVSAIDHERYSGDPIMASGLSAVANMAQVAASGPAMSCRDEPNIA